MQQLLVLATEAAEHGEHIATTFRDVSWLIPVLPFVAAILILFIGRRTPGKGAALGIISVGVGLIIGLGSFLEAIKAPHQIVEHAITWIDFGNFHLDLG